MTLFRCCLVPIIIVVYKLIRTGSRTDPCGTPNGRCCWQDSVPDMLMLWCLSEKYDLNHRRAVQELPKIYTKAL